MKRFKVYLYDEELFETEGDSAESVKTYLVRVECYHPQIEVKEID